MESSESDLSELSDAVGDCPVGVGDAGVGVEGVGVPAGVCVLLSGVALEFSGAFCDAVGVEAAGTSWPMSKPAST